jgi:formylmethanofuran dehydrogenase subunit E
MMVPGVAPAPATSIVETPFDELLREAVAFHGHTCPGQVLGVRMAVAGCREVGLVMPKRAGKRLVVFAEIDRCATDAIEALTGVRVGKRTLKVVDYGKMASTFVDVERGRAVRIVARDEARARASEWAPGLSEERARQIAAYRIMPEPVLLAVTPVVIAPGWLDRRRRRVYCAACGEGINYEREVRVAGRVLCRPCAGEAYYTT